MAVRTPDQLLAGRYRTLGRLGSGGAATVYLAEDERLGRRVAVKRLHGGMADDDLVRRFRREARLGAALNHPNLVTVYDIASHHESVLATPCARRSPRARWRQSARSRSSAAWARRSTTLTPTACSTAT